jgi:hypothetical protein
MSKTTPSPVYEAQVKNVRKIESSRRILKKHINDCLFRQHKAEADVLTSLYVLLYCTWYEAQFLKLLYTPYGFSGDEIAQVLDKKKYSTIEEKWNKLLSLAIQKVSGWDKSSELPNHLQTIKRYFEEYVIDKALLRNKFAHGQWVEALNSGNNKVNKEVTVKLRSITIVDVDIWFFVTGKLVEVMQMMIATPTKHYRRFYYTLFTEIEDYLERTKAYSVSKKVVMLGEKKSWHLKN